MDNKYYVISGNIGVGKTTLARRLESEFNWRVNEEDMNNPYLPLFYQNMSKWGFHLQLWFLANRVESYKKYKPDEVFIQDRSHEEENFVFTHNLFLNGIISRDEFKLYQDIYKTVDELLPKPQKIIYLKSKVQTLAQRIAARGREYEQSIEMSYLNDLQSLYDNWVNNAIRKHSNIIVIDTDEFDILNDDLKYLL